MRITTGSPPPRDGQIPILSTSIQPSPAAHADLPHQSAGSDSFRKDFLPLLILLLLKTPENEGMLKGACRSSRCCSTDTRLHHFYSMRRRRRSIAISAMMLSSAVAIR